MEESYVSDPSLPLFPSPFPFPAVSLWDMQPSGCLLQHELNYIMYSPESWFYDFSTIPLHFPHGSFAPLELQLHQCALSWCTFMFPHLPRASQHPSLVSITFIPFFSHVSVLPVSTIPLQSSSLCRGTTSSAMTPFIWDIDLGALLEAEGEDANDSRGSSALKFSTGIRTRILSLSPFVLWGKCIAQCA